MKKTIGNEVDKLIGSRIKKLRLEKNLTQNELAREILSTQSEVVKIENGQRSINMDKLVRFSRALEKEIVYFLSDFS